MDRKRTFFEKVGRFVPGYMGYEQRDNRRSSDKQLRNRIANDLLLAETKIETHKQDLIRKNDLQTAMEWEQVRKAINTLSPKIKNATYGESGFFSKEKIKEDELNSIYEKDSELADRVKIIAETVSDKLNEPMMTAAIMQMLSAIDKLLIARTNYINQYK